MSGVHLSKYVGKRIPWSCQMQCILTEYNQAAATRSPGLSSRYFNPGCHSGCSHQRQIFRHSLSTSSDALHPSAIHPCCLASASCACRHCEQTRPSFARQEQHVRTGSSYGVNMKRDVGKWWLRCGLPNDQQSAQKRRVRVR